MTLASPQAPYLIHQAEMTIPFVIHGVVEAVPFESGLDGNRK